LKETTGKPEVKRKDNIKMYLREGGEGVDWINVSRQAEVILLLLAC